jgi:hypothetical protein
MGLVGKLLMFFSVAKLAIAILLCYFFASLLISYQYLSFSMILFLKVDQLQHQLGKSYLALKHLVIFKSNILNLVVAIDCVSYMFHDNILNFESNSTVLDYFLSTYQNILFFSLIRL